MIYLDSCLLIYLVERDPVFGDSMARAVSDRPEARFAITPLVQLECLVKPIRDGDLVIRRMYENAFAALTVLDMPEPVHRQAAELRARFAMKTPDALHLASAQHHHCTALWTDDRRLGKAARGLDVDVTRG